MRDFGAQVRAGVYPRRELLSAIGEARATPAAACRLARVARTLDLRAQLEVVRRNGVRCDVVSCDGDGLTPPEHCRQIARLAGGRLREIAARGGHVWTIADPSAFAHVEH